MTTIAHQLRKRLITSDWLTINGQPVAFPYDDLEDLTIHHSRAPKRNASPQKDEGPGSPPEAFSDPSRSNHGRRSAQSTRR